MFSKVRRQLLFGVAAFFVFILSCSTAEIKEKEIEKIELLIEGNSFYEASKMIERSLKKDPKNSYLYFLKGTLKLKEKNFKEAKENLEYACNIRCDIPALLFNLGNLYYTLNDYHNSIRVLQEFVRKNKNNSMVGDAKRIIEFCFKEIIKEEGTDLSGVKEENERGGVFLYRKLYKKDMVEGKLKFYLAREITYFTTQVSIIFKNNTDQPLKYDLKKISLLQKEKIIRYDKERYYSGIDNFPFEGELGPKKYAYIMIYCPELDLTKPVKIEFKDLLLESFEIEF